MLFPFHQQLFAIMLSGTEEGPYVSQSWGEILCVTWFNYNILKSSQWPEPRTEICINVDSRIGNKSGF
jgi:hypothetical protein